MFQWIHSYSIVDVNVVHFPSMLSCECQCCAHYKYLSPIEADAFSLSLVYMVCTYSSGANRSELQLRGHGHTNGQQR